jgi:hypothetical protein
VAGSVVLFEPRLFSRMIATVIAIARKCHETVPQTL